MTSNGLYSNDPRPRLCHLRRWTTFNGYGFNLHSEKAKPGQYIGKVDPNSPADSAGLRESDRIIEVNYVPIGNENHRQVVARIKEGVTRNGTKYPDEVILLVLDPIADEFYKSKSLVARSSDDNVLKYEAEIRNETRNGDNSSHSSKSGSRSESPVARETPPPPPPPSMTREYKNTGATVTQNRNGGSPAMSKMPNGDDLHRENYRAYGGPPSPVLNRDQRPELPPTNTYTNINTSVKPSPDDFYGRPVGANSSQASPAKASGSGGVLEIKMTAAEYREKLKAQGSRRRDPRQDSHMSMKEKHDLIDHL